MWILDSVIDLERHFRLLDDDYCDALISLLGAFTLCVLHTYTHLD